MHFTEKWFNPAKIRQLHKAMDDVKNLDGEIVEVGSWEGRSSIEIANHFHPKKLHVIDHWLGDLTNLKSGVADLAKQRDVFAQFKANMDEATQGNYIVHRSSWRDVNWNEIPKLSFLFIDGEHTFPEVSDNILVALPRMVKGGVLAGDDYTIPQVRKAVLTHFSELEVNHCSGAGAAIWWVVFK